MKIQQLFAVVYTHVYKTRVICGIVRPVICIVDNDHNDISKT